MVDKTLEELIVLIESDLYQTAGIATQVYSQQLLVNKITAGFIQLANDPDQQWSRYDRYQQYTLDGVNGRTTSPVNTIYKSFDDITSVYIGDTDRRLVAQPFGVNPFKLTGNNPLWIAPDDIDTFRVFPTTATGDITVVGRSLPTAFENNDIVPFDYIALNAFVCWQYMTDDGSNPGAAEKFRQLFEIRYKQLGKLQDQAPTAINGAGMFDYPRDWYVR